MYDGEAFKHLEATSLDDEDLKIAQGSLQIISGLYGLLGPLDLIKPYRWRAFNFLIEHHDTNVDTHSCGPFSEFLEHAVDTLCVSWMSSDWI